MKKTEAIRLARRAVPPPVSLDAAHFVNSIPADFSCPQGDCCEVMDQTYLGAQHTRAFAICRVALAYMGFEHLPLSLEDGGTVTQLMKAALNRAERGWGGDEPVPFWQVQLRQTAPPPDAGD